MIAFVKNRGRTMALLLRRTAIFVVIVMIWALLAAAAARAQSQPAPELDQPPPQAQRPEPDRPLPQQSQPTQPATPHVQQADLVQPEQVQAPKQLPAMVPFSGYRAGTIVVRTNDRRLYYVMKGDKALEFPVGVGKDGWRWFGRARIEGKYIKPAWQAPPELARGRFRPVIPGGAPNNPMGVAALTMRNGEYAIHGTNNPKSVGGFVSHGCIRMYNKDITRLFALVQVGTPVVVEK
jgi:lipoprotein-anchoring transpeptidase ErfK/SrfK